MDYIERLLVDKSYRWRRLESCNNYSRLAALDSKQLYSFYILQVMIEEEEGLPNLVYISREKRPKHPHHFKAGAMNVLVYKLNFE